MDYTVQDEVAHGLQSRSHTPSDSHGSLGRSGPLTPVDGVQVRERRFVHVVVMVRLLGERGREGSKRKQQTVCVCKGSFENGQWFSLWYVTVDRLWTPRKRP